MPGDATLRKIAGISEWMRRAGTESHWPPRSAWLRAHATSLNEYVQELSAVVAERDELRDKVNQVREVLDSIRNEPTPIPGVFADTLEKISEVVDGDR